MNYVSYLQGGGSIVKALIEKVMQSQGQDQLALQQLMELAESGDQDAIDFFSQLKGETIPSKNTGGRVVPDSQDPNSPNYVQTGTVDGRRYQYLPYQGEGNTPTNRFEYVGEDGNIYGLDVVYQGEGVANDSIYTMNGLPYNDPEGRRVIADRQKQVSEQYKNGGNMIKKQIKKNPKMGKCGCQLKRVGGRLIEVDGCTGLPVHRNGSKIEKYNIGGNFIRGFGDFIGSVAGRAAEAGREGWGYLQRGIGTAAQAVTNGERGNGMVRRGLEDIDAAAGTGAKVNSAVDNFSQKAGNVYDDIQRAVRTFVPGVGWVLNAADSYLDEKVGNYDATTGNLVTSDGQVRQVVTPRYEDQKTLSQEQIQKSNEMMGARPDANLAVGGPGAGPINRVSEPVVDPTGRYSKYGMLYKRDEAGNIVEDWDNTQVSNRDISRAARQDNWNSYRSNRAAIRNSGMSLAQQEAALREQRQARRQANQEARDWRRGQQGAYDQSRMGAINQNVTGYNHNGGIISYAQYLN